MIDFNNKGDGMSLPSPRAPTRFFEFQSASGRNTSAAAAQSLLVMRMIPSSRVVLQPLVITQNTVWLTGSTYRLQTIPSSVP